MSGANVVAVDFPAGNRSLDSDAAFLQESEDRKSDGSILANEVNKGVIKL
jgi:hypothetical protein